MGEVRSGEVPGRGLGGPSTATANSQTASIGKQDRMASSIDLITPHAAQHASVADAHAYLMGGGVPD